MSHTRVVGSVMAAVTLAAAAFARSGDCPREWTPGWTRTGVDRQVRALTTFDLDGPGPAPASLIIAGDFYSFNGVALPNPVAWDGTSLTPMRTGLRSGTARTLAVIDVDGPGPLPAELYAGGSFNMDSGTYPIGVMRWSVDHWVGLGTSSSGGLSSVISLVLHDFDGPGPNPPRLVALSDGNPSAGLIQQWNGTAWTAVGTNNRQTSTKAIASVDHDGDGPNPPVLYMCVGNSGAQKFNGTSWIPVTGLSAALDSLAGFDLDGPGPQLPKLIAVGNSINLGGPQYTSVSYDGAVWQGVGSFLGFTNVPNSLRVVPGPQPTSPPSLLLTLPGFSPRIFRWNDGGLVGGGPAGGWGPLASATQPISPFTINGVAFFDRDGPGPEPADTIVGGDFRFTSNDTAITFLAVASGTSWRPLARFSAVPDGSVLDLKAVDIDGDGPQPTKLFVGGAFSTVRGVASPALATWDGREWAPTGTFAADSPSGLRVAVMTTFDDDGPGPRPPGLYVGGYFNSLNGMPVGHIARLDAAGWSPLGAGLANLRVSGGTFGVSAMLPVDLDGPGPQGESLVVASGFSDVNSLPNGKIAAWNGTTWTPMGANGPDEVLGLAAFPQASGLPQLIAVNYRGVLSVWTGTTWQNTPSFFSGGGEYVYFARMLDDDGPGPAAPYLLVGGPFESTGGLATPQGLAKYDGQVWSAVNVSDNFARTEIASVLDLDGSGPEPARAALAGYYQNTTGASQSIAIRNAGGGVGGADTFDVLGGYTFTGGARAVEVFADEPGRLPSIYMAGSFSGVGLINVTAGVPTGGLARFGCTPCVQFTSQPTGGAFRAGRPVTLAAAPLIDGFGATYQWRRSGSPLADGNGLAGATTPTLTIASARTADAGSYDLLVSASCGSTLSAAATVNVICSADFNADGAVTIDDVFGFIAAFLANQVESDFTRDFRIGVQDLFDFLNAYFRGC